MAASHGGSPLHGHRYWMCPPPVPGILGREERAREGERERGRKREMQYSAEE